VIEVAEEEINLKTSEINDETEDTTQMTLDI